MKPLQTRALPCHNTHLEQLVKHLLKAQGSIVVENFNASTTTEFEIHQMVTFNYSKRIRMYTDTLYICILTERGKNDNCFLI